MSCLQCLQNSRPKRVVVSAGEHDLVSSLDTTLSLCWNWKVQAELGSAATGRGNYDLFCLPYFFSCFNSGKNEEAGQGQAGQRQRHSPLRSNGSQFLRLCLDLNFLKTETRFFKKRRRCLDVFSFLKAYFIRGGLISWFLIK
jgi:hypothetical protein